MARENLTNLNHKQNTAVNDAKTNNDKMQSTHISITSMNKTLLKQCDMSIRYPTTMVYHFCKKSKILVPKECKEINSLNNRNTANNKKC